MRLRSFYVIIFACFVLVSGRRRGRKGRQSKEVAPVIVGPPLPVVGLVRGTVALVCNATGNPRPHVEWYKENNVKVSRNRYEVAYSEYDGGVISALWIFNARKRRDGTSYTCQASNRIGRDNRQAQVTLIDEDDAPSGYPQIIVAPRTDSVDRNKSMTLPCRSSGTSATTIQWYKDYLPLKINASRMNISASGSLNIMNSDDSDQGKYYCSARNHYGVAFSEASSVYVRVRRVAPWFRFRPLSEYQVQQNGNLNITCVASGSPRPNVKWQKITRWGIADVPKLKMTRNSNEAMFGDEVRGRLVGRAVLMIRNAQVSANYTCVASSTMDTIRANTELRVKTIPKPPVYLRRIAAGESSSSLRLRWKPGDRETVNSYTICYRLRFNGATLNTITNVSSTSFTVTGLKPYTEYEFRVSAVNAQGEGNKSEALYLKTLEAAPGSSPVDVKAYLIGINTVMVVWSEPTTPNGVISQYKLYYSSNDILPVTEWSTKEVEGDRRLTSLRNLSPSVTYSVRVAALNSVGEGPLSQPVMVKIKQGVPSQPQKFRGTAVSPNSVRFVWEEPAGDSNQDYQIISYTLVYDCNEQHCGRQKQITFPPNPNFMLLNLHSFTSYQVKMAAQTRFGKGPFTSTIVVTTLADAPSAPPQNVQASASGETWITVSWQPPLKGNQNGELTNYTVYFSKIQRIETASTVVAPSAQNYARITDLKPFTTYYVWVSASTSPGEGPSSSAITASTTESTPEGPPQNVTAFALNSTTIRVRWQPVPHHLSNGNIRGYQVAYVISDAPTSRTHIVSAYEGELSKIKENQVLCRSALKRRRKRMTCVEIEVEYILTNLQPKTRYSLSVTAFTIKGAGPPSVIKYATTMGEVPGIPTLHSISEGSSALVTWAPPQNENSDCTGYVLKYRCSNCPGSDQAQSGWFVKRFDDTILSYRPTKNDRIVPGWTYTFKLAALNDEGPGAEATSELSLPTVIPSEAPGRLSGETVLVVKESSYGIQLSWSPPPWTSNNGQITGYGIYWRKSQNNEDFKFVTTTNTEYLMPNVKLEERYEFQITAQNAAGEGPKSSSLFITITGNKSTQSNITVTNLRASEISTNTVWLTWVSPAVIKPQFSVSYISQSNQMRTLTDVDGSHVVVAGLDVNTAYNFTVTMFVSFGEEPVQFGSRWIIVRTAPKLYLLPPQFQTVSKDATVTLTLSQDVNNDLIKQYALIVVPWNKNTVLNTDSYSYASLRKNLQTSSRQKREVATFRPYITAVFDQELLPRMFSLGDGLNVGNYVNKALQRGTKYRIFLRVIYDTELLSFSSTSFSDIICIPEEDFISSTNPTPKVSNKQVENIVQPEKSTEMSNHLWIIGVVVGCLFVLGFIVLFLVFRFWRARGKAESPLIKYTAPVAVKQKHDKRIEHDPVEMRRQHYQTSGMKSHPPISVSDMSGHIERLSANDNLKFSQEYESIDPGQKFMWENSNMDINKSKNRYANVVAYDHSRLTLSPIDGVRGSDYINANYISGYRRQNAYIATQGPTRDTIPDFWRMVWEQRSNVIVMMTKCEERSKVKCNQYWPSEGSETYGLMKVTLIDEMQLATYSFRTMALFKSGCSERREIKHFQYTAWPDHGVPEHPTPVLNFMRRVKSSYLSNTGPIVVHCSAGVGRAGCLICIDSTLERMKQESSIDIYGQVTCMRAERNYMVQTEDQYIFIHYAILEAINCGNTELPARNLYSHLHKLTTPEDDNPVTAMELEFKRLACSKASASRFVSANLHCNKFKNRLVNILPYEGSRVCLKPIRGVEGSDYINANFVDGYRQKQAYIATQGPLAETTDDFWRMLWEHKSTIIVMLTQLNESGRDKCHQYWPEDRSDRYQYFVVDPMKVFDMPQYILREFKVTDARDGQSRTIRQFHFTDWPEQAVPKSGEGFIDFIGQVHKTKEQFGQEGPITIHCSAGVGRTGVFITLSIALERMRFENVVDMFQTVKMLRTQRPAMVQTEDQYQFCYRAALEYLGSFDHYANA